MPALFPSRGFRRTRERASGLLFALGADDLTTTVITGQTLALTRATGRTVVDSQGLLRTLAHSQPGFTCGYNATDAAWEPALGCEDERTNVCLQSEDFGTTWAAVGTPVRTAAAATCGDLVLDLLSDDAAGTLEGYTQAVTFTGNATKGISCFVRQGTSTSSVIRLRDTTASADRLLAVVTWSGGVPSVAISGAGTHLATQTYGNSTYRLLFRTDSVTAANTNQIEVYPATTSGLVTTNTGTLYVGGVQAEDYDYPRAYAKTTTASVTHNKDHWTTTLPIAPQSMTAYLRLLNPVWNSASWGPSTDTPSFWVLGTGAGAVIYMGYGAATNLFRGAIFDGTTTVTATATAGSAGVLEVCAQFDALTTAPRVRIDVGSGFGSYSGTATGFSTFASGTLLVGHSSTVTTGASSRGSCNAGLRKFLLASGARTLAQMRGLAV